MSRRRSTMPLPPSFLTHEIFDPASIAGAIFYAGLFVLLAWAAGRAISLGIHRYLDRAEAAGADYTSVRFLGQLGRAAVYVIAFLFYARLVPALQSLGTTWLASLGIVSVVIGLATQSTLSNLIAGVSLILYHPFRVGERIQVITPAGPEIGVVESIDLAYTTVRAAAGRRIVLPNSLITNQTSINFSRSFARVVVEIPLIVRHGTRIEAAKEILLDAAASIPAITKVNGCFVTHLTKDGIALMLSAICQDPDDIASIKSDFLERVKQAFDAAGIAVA